MMGDTRTATAAMGAKPIVASREAATTIVVLLTTTANAFSAISTSANALLLYRAERVAEGELLVAPAAPVNAQPTDVADVVAVGALDAAATAASPVASKPTPANEAAVVNKMETSRWWGEWWCGLPPTPSAATNMPPKRWSTS